MFMHEDRPLILFFSGAWLLFYVLCFSLLWPGEENWNYTNLKKGSDLEQHFVAAQIVREGKINLLYHKSYLLRRIQNGEEPHFIFNYVYSPLVAKILSWTAGKNYLHFYERWLAASLLLLASSIWMLHRTFPKIKFLPIYVLGFLPLAQSLFVGQNTCLGLAIICGTGILLNASLPFTAGLLLSLMFYKPQLLILLGFIFLVMRWFRALGGLVLGCTFWLALTILIGGWQNFLDWAKILIGMGEGHAQTQNWGINITWVGFLHTLKIHVNAFLWMALTPLPLTFAGIYLKSTHWKPAEILFMAITLCLPLLPYAMTYDILLTLPAFLMLLFSVGNSLLKNIILLIWWSIAFLAYLSSHLTFVIYAPFLTFISIYSILKN